MDILDVFKYFLKALGYALLFVIITFNVGAVLLALSLYIQP